MHYTAMKALLVDDDQWFQLGFNAWFRNRFPGISLEVRSEPNVNGDFCIYLIDNDFHGERLAGQLASQIRQRSPNALVLALSATLDAPTLKTLLNQGCHGAFEKGNHEEFEQLAEILATYLNDYAKVPKSQSGFLATLRSITDLLKAWNSRLDNQESTVASH